MTTSRDMLQLLGLSMTFLTVSSGVQAQGGDASRCDEQVETEATITCGLLAAGIHPLSDGRRTDGQRELRFWMLPGNGIPWRVTIVREDSGIVSGRHLMIWYESEVGDSNYDAMCGHTWSNGAAALCQAKLAAEPDWTALLGTLDSLGMRRIPVNPVPQRPCPPPPPGSGDRIICNIVADGMEFGLEYRDRSIYWSYHFQQVPDTTSANYPRDRAILRLMACAIREADVPWLPTPERDMRCAPPT